MSAALLLGLGASAVGIESANTVGYTTVTCEAGKYKMIGVNFVNPNTSVMTLGTVVSSSGFTTGDALLILSSSGSYDSYGYVSAQDAEEEEIPTGAGWYLNGEFSNNVTITNGASFWLLPQNLITVIVAGEVKTTWSYLAKANQYAMLSWPFPTTCTLGSFTYVGTTGDAILIPDASGAYKSYGYVSAQDAEEEEIPTGAGWYLDGVFSNDTVVPMNQGFWLLPSANATISASISL